MPRFCPSLKNLGRPNDSKFSWGIFLKNKEYLVAPGVIGVLFAMSLMKGVMYPLLRNEGSLLELLKHYFIG